MSEVLSLHVHTVPEALLGWFCSAGGVVISVLAMANCSSQRGVSEQLTYPSIWEPVMSPGRPVTIDLSPVSYLRGMPRSLNRHVKRASSSFLTLSTTRPPR